MTVYRASALELLKKEQSLLDELRSVENQIVSKLYIIDECSVKKARLKATEEVAKLRAHEKAIETELIITRQEIKSYLLHLFE